MSKEFRLQDPGEGIHEAEILEVNVSEGDAVKDGDPLLAVETDKAAIDVPSPFTGTVERLQVKVGQVVHVGDVLMTYRDGAETDEEAEEEEAPGQKSDEKEAEAESAKAPSREPPAEGARAPAREKKAKQPIPAAPATRRLARELGVELGAVEPSGPHGRVTDADVRAAAGAAEEGETRTQAPAAGDEWGPVERIPLRSVRRTIARQMARSWSRIPHVTHQDVADITDLERLRQRHQEDVEKRGGHLSMTALVLKAVVGALRQFPRFNASLDDEAEEILLKHYIHIGVAVATEKGLLVPVVRDVDRKSATELAVEIKSLAERARAGELEREEMLGASFTVTNPGTIGGTAFTPIVNHPQVAILGMARSHLEPVVQGDLDRFEIVPRLRLPLCLAFDHRVNDGAEAARFMRALIDILHDPESFLLMV